MDETVRAIGSEGKATLDAARDTGRALRQLASADFALARSALGRALAWTAVAIVFGASSWLLAMGALIALLQAFGLSWLASIACAAALSLAVTGLAIWRVSVFFDLAGMHATRRQLARLGLFNE
ncbi:MAG: phage holin family protein, partial [Proteobacteria bacterium]|nr:phage holin family protein [Pseudomonadota bacterium]